MVNAIKRWRCKVKDIIYDRYYQIERVPFLFPNNSNQFFRFSNDSPHFLQLETSNGSYIGTKTLTLGSGVFCSMKSIY